VSRWNQARRPDVRHQSTIRPILAQAQGAKGPTAGQLYGHPGRIMIEQQSPWDLQAIFKGRMRFVCLVEKRGII
jgi:hypothetical protein